MLAKHRKLRRMGMERLEAREVMAGDVHAAVVDGNLFLTGDDRGNGVRVYQVAGEEGHYRVEGLAQDGSRTKINGENAIDVRHIYGNLSIELHGGDDVLAIGSPDQPTANQKITTIQMGFGDDAVDISSSQLGKVNLSTGVGNDVVRFTNTTVRYGADIKLFAGDDTLELNNVSVAYALDINAGEGNDQVDLTGVKVGYDLNVLGEDGDDHLHLHNVEVGQRFHLEGGDQDDHVVLDTVSADSFYAHLGGGRDKLIVKNSTARKADFSGDGGYDKYFEGLGNNLKHKSIAAFSVEALI